MRRLRARRCGMPADFLSAGRLREGMSPVGSPGMSEIFAGSQKSSTPRTPSGPRLALQAAGPSTRPGEAGVTFPRCDTLPGSANGRREIMHKSFAIVLYLFLHFAARVGKISASYIPTHHTNNHSIGRLSWTGNSKRGASRHRARRSACRSRRRAHIPAAVPTWRTNSQLNPGVMAWLREIHRQGRSATELRVGPMLPAGEDLPSSPSGEKPLTVHSDADWTCRCFSRTDLLAL